MATNLAFAANFSFVKMISPQPVPPLAINLLRVGFSLILFWLLWLFAKEKQGIRKEHLGRFVLCGLTGVAINQVAFIKGLTLTSTVHAALLGLATPLIITLLAVWILGEKLTGAKACGLLLGIGGAGLLIASKSSTGAGANPLLGDALVLLNAISYAAYFILVKPLMQTYSALHVVRWMFTFGMLFILPFAWTDTASIAWTDLSPGGFGALAFIVVAGTFMAYVFNAYGIRQLGAATTGSYIYTQPVFAVLLAAFFLSETLSPDKVLAAVFIFAGVYWVGKK